MPGAEETDEPAEAQDAPTDWGAPGAAPREFKCFWFHIGGQKFTHLDLTGKEALALERRTGVPWGELRPSVLEQRMAVLEAFLARTEPDGAADVVGGMSLQDLEAAVTMEFDDMPDSYEDGSPKATAGP